MKKAFLMLLVLLICLPLCACGQCEHEWTVADCANGAVCTLCNEPGAPALGHDWDMATCDLPKTCARCGETEGEALGHTGSEPATCEQPMHCSRCNQIMQEPLGHSFGDWTVTTKTERTHSCISCGLTETEEIDEGTYWLHHMQGYWSFYFMQDPWKVWVRTMGDYPPNLVPHYVIIEDSNIKVFENGECTLDKTLTFFKEDGEIWFEVRDESDVVLINVVYRPESEYSIGDHIVLQFSNSWVSLDDYENQKAIVATEWWRNAEDGSTYFIILNEDGTFTANWGEEISGGWMTAPAEFVYEEELKYYESECRLFYEKDGERIVLNGHIDYSVEQNDGHPVWESDRNTARLTFDEERVLRYHALNHPLESLERVEKAKSQIVGNWRLAAIDVGSQIEFNPDYSVTVYADGTFTMQLDKEFTGTWSYDSTSSANIIGYVNENKYDYSIHFDYTLDGCGGIFDASSGELGIRAPVDDDYSMLYFVPKAG